MYLFEAILSVSLENIEFELRGHTFIEWSSFILNPRRLRGSDFLMRWSQGVWSEERMIQAVNGTNEFFAMPYGPSSTAPEDDVREFELYFERLEAAGLRDVKRPDLLVFRQNEQTNIENLVTRLGGVSELPFTSEDNQTIQEILGKAVIAVECENSLWKGKMMPDYGVELRPQKRLEGKPGLKIRAVLPTIIMKEEDRERLHTWERENRVPIHIWHVFFDVAYGLALQEAQRLIDEGYILPTDQIFQAPGGATTKKSLYKFYYHYGYPLGDSIEEPSLSARHIVDKNGHILPYVHFEGGRMSLRMETLDILRTIADG
ncbi:MAG TPA: AccI family restriction endonuclease [Anaerolineales bacterium]|nr:AccI family restriction endonuclease [Anaerolineales bacterium]